MVDAKPEVKKVNFSCKNCGNTLLIVHNLTLPVYFNMGVICPSCKELVDGTMVDVYRSKPDFEMMNRLQDPEKFI